MGVISGVIIGAIGSILAVIVIELFLRSKPALFLFGSSYRLAIRLRREGIIAFQFTREDYRERLPTFLSYADHSIAIVSISLRLTSDEGELLQLFKNRIAERSDFRISISLIAPKSPAAALAAASLNVTGDHLVNEEIRPMLRKLVGIRNDLPESDRPRLRILVHNFFPMGSAILLDADPTQGRIQVETKLFRAPRIESFGYEVVGSSPFYSRNYRAWMRVIDASVPVTDEDLIN
jgi:hypothetical protein